MPSVHDARFMELALSLGRRGLGNTWPNPAVGAIVVREDAGEPVILGRGWTQPGGRPHAEVEAIRRAGEAARGATIYTTLEPCSHHGKTPPCVGAILDAGIARVVSALEDPNPDVAGQGHAALRACGVAVDLGVGAQQAMRDHAGHIRRIRNGRPHVTLKLAVSADGKVGLAGRKPVQITSEAATARVHRMRAQHDAILIGTGTALADDPSLTCRLPGMVGRSPVRVVLDSQFRLSIESTLARTATQTPLWILGSSQQAALRREHCAHLEKLGAKIFAVGMVDARLDLKVALHLLAERGITRLLVEGGPTVAASFLAADLVDEAALFRSPTAIGPDGIDALEGLPLDALTGSPRLRLESGETAGPDHIEHFARA